MAKKNEVESSTDLTREEKTLKEKLEENMVKIRIPVDKLNKGDTVVPVGINGIFWNVPRGQTVEVPEQVAMILEDAKYI